MYPTPDLSVFDGIEDMERCGVIFERSDGQWFIVEVPNRARDPWNDFQINIPDVREIQLAPDEYRIVGVAHTHPNTTRKEPTPSDIEGIPKGLVGLVYHPASGSIIWYTCAGILDEQLKKED